MILSEDFESGIGWSYEGCITSLAEDPGIATMELGKIIIDDFLTANENDAVMGDSSTLALIDQSMVRVLYSTWVDFAYANEAALLGSNYRRAVDRSSRTRPGEKLDELAEYYITDIMAVAQNLDSAEADALSSALDNAIVYYRATEDNASMTGRSVTLPYGDQEFCGSLKEIFTNCGFDSEYIAWLEKFSTASGSDSYYSYDTWEDDWAGWDDYDDSYDWDEWDHWDDEDYWSDDDWGWTEWEYEDYWGIDRWSDELLGYEDDWWSVEDWYSYEGGYYDDGWQEGDSWQEDSGSWEDAADDDSYYCCYEPCCADCMCSEYDCCIYYYDDGTRCDNCCCGSYYE